MMTTLVRKQQNQDEGGGSSGDESEEEEEEGEEVGEAGEETEGEEEEEMTPEKIIEQCIARGYLTIMPLCSVHGSRIYFDDLCNLLKKNHEEQLAIRRKSSAEIYHKALLTHIVRYVNLLE
jgi:hypothetical protein